MLLRLSETEGNKHLLELGFKKFKVCGSDKKGLLLALGFGYIESLILTMNYKINNILYILPMY